MKSKIIILTGNELRHIYFRKYLANDGRFKVLKTYAESDEKSLEKMIFADSKSSDLQKKHVEMRINSENYFFQNYVKTKKDNSQIQVIAKGAINHEVIVNEICDLKPDLLVCYGSSLIRSELLKKFKNKFLNVHLGLSPYYRGSGTNIWPIINNDLQMLGATFMFIDEGIDTGKIIHQFREALIKNDDPHKIGNRIIKKMAKYYCEIIFNFHNLSSEKQPSAKGKLYYQKDFNADACLKLYENLTPDKIDNYLAYKKNLQKLPYIVQNKIIKN